MHAFLFETITRSNVSNTRRSKNNHRLVRYDDKMCSSYIATQYLRNTKMGTWGSQALKTMTFLGPRKVLVVKRQAFKKKKKHYIP